MRYSFSRIELIPSCFSSDCHAYLPQTALLTKALHVLGIRCQIGRSFQRPNEMLDQIVRGPPADSAAGFQSLLDGFPQHRLLRAALVLRPPFKLRGKFLRQFAAYNRHVLIIRPHRPLTRRIAAPLDPKTVQLWPYCARMPTQSGERRWRNGSPFA